MALERTARKRLSASVFAATLASAFHGLAWAQPPCASLGELRSRMAAAGPEEKPAEADAFAACAERVKTPLLTPARTAGRIRACSRFALPPRGSSLQGT